MGYARSLVAAALVLLASPALAGDFTSVSFTPEQGGGVGFLMPSNNVECTYTPPGGTATYTTADGGAELSCDRLEPSYLRFTLAAKGKAKLYKDVGDQYCCGGTNTLGYGSEWRVAPFTCDSATSGLTCTRDDGHGFFISKASIKVY